MRERLMVLVLAGLAAGCSTSSAPSATEPAKAGVATTATRTAPPAVPLDQRFVAQLQAAARAYPGYTKLGDWPKWAPTMCSVPPAPGPLLSHGTDAAGHGRKLYFLYVKDRAAYQPARDAAQPVGQVLVKRSYASKRVRPATGDRTDWGKDHGTVARDGWVYALGKERALFIMLKLDPATPGTDAGWVYGTVTPDGARVTSAGRVASCMRCHVTADNDRMFGPTADGLVSDDPFAAHRRPRSAR